MFLRARNKHISVTVLVMLVAGLTITEIRRYILARNHNLSRMHGRKFTPLKSILCIEENICKTHFNDTFHIYQRKVDIIQRVDAKINETANTVHSSFVVPNIVHFVQYTDTASGKTVNEFEFHHMVSVLSAHRIQKPDRIYFWLDKEPVSRYWKTLRQIVPMYLIKRERPTSIRGRKIHFVTKISNIIRLEAILEFGGIYLDLDVLVVKSLDPLRRYDATMGKEDGNQFCNAVLIGTPWAGFFRRWHQEHHTLNENHWNHHSGKVPYLLSKVIPSLIHIEDTAFFRPAYYELDDLFKKGQLHDWRNKNYCVHLWIRVYKGRKRTDSEIDRWNTTVGEVYRYILYGDWRPIS